jgi:hypothetical protein
MQKSSPPGTNFGARQDRSLHLRVMVVNIVQIAGLYDTQTLRRGVLSATQKIVSDFLPTCSRESCICAHILHFCTSIMHRMLVQCITTLSYYPLLHRRLFYGTPIADIPDMNIPISVSKRQTGIEMNVWQRDDIHTFMESPPTALRLRRHLISDDETNESESNEHEYYDPMFDIDDSPTYFDPWSAMTEGHTCPACKATDIPFNKDQCTIIAKNYEPEGSTTVAYWVNRASSHGQCCDTDDCIHLDANICELCVQLIVHRLEQLTQASIATTNQLHESISDCCSHEPGALAWPRSLTELVSSYRPYSWAIAGARH